MIIDVAGTVAQIKKKSAKSTRVDQAEYVNEKLRSWPRPLRWIKLNPTKALLYTGAVIYAGFCSILTIGQSSQNPILLYLLAADILAFPLAFIVIQVIEGWGMSMIALFRWQSVAAHMRSNAQEAGLSDQQLLTGLAALSESRKVEERFALAIITAAGGLWAITEKLYGHDNPLPENIRKLSFVPNEKHYIYLAIGYGALLFIYLIRYYAPSQWDKQLMVYLKDPK